MAASFSKYLLCGDALHHVRSELDQLFVVLVQVVDKVLQVLGEASARYALHLLIGELSAGFVVAHGDLLQLDFVVVLPNVSSGVVPEGFRG